MAPQGQVEHRSARACRWMDSPARMTNEKHHPARPDADPELEDWQPIPAPDPEPPEITDPRDRGGTGAPVGADNIREGRVGGVLAPPGGTHGQGQGG